MASSVEFKNMLAYNSTWKLEINETSKDIERIMSELYDNIISCIQNEDDEENYRDMIDNAEIIFSPIIYTYSRYVGNDLANSYYNVNTNEIIKSVFKMEDTENIDVFQNLTKNIILFSIFDFSSTEVSPKSTISDWESIFFAESGNEYYKFRNNNRLFDLLDKITSEEWRNWTISFKKTKGINLRQTLIDGFCKDKSGEIHYVFDSRNSVLSFINSLLTEIGFYFGTRNFFLLDNDTPTWQFLSQKIIETLQTTKDIDKQIESEAKAKNAQLGNSNNNINFSFSVNGDEEDAILKYIEIYDYAVDLFQKYVDTIQSKNSDDIIKDKYVKRMFETITGSSSSEKFSPPGTLYSGRASSIGLSQYFSTQASSSIDESKIEVQQNTTNLDLNGEKENLKGSIVTHDNGVGDIFDDVSKKNNLDAPLQFFELAMLSDLNNVKGKNSEELQNEITAFCNMISGNLVAKIAFFSLNNYIKTNDEDTVRYEKKVSGTSGNQYRELFSGTLVFPSYKILRRYQYVTNAMYLKINGVNFSSFNDIYKKLGKLVYDYLYGICREKTEQDTSNNNITHEAENATEFDEYIKNRFAHGYFTEKDFFYLKDNARFKKAPVNSFVDIEFRVPRKNDNGEWVAEWIPVTAIRKYDDVETDITVNTGTTDVHAGTYFSSFDLDDKGGVKEVELTLKSVNDMNLENIIFYSLAMDQKKSIILDNEDSSLTMSHLEQILKDGESNFRMRFGYRDRVPKDEGGEETTITTSNAASNEFMSRDKIFDHKDDSGRFVKPVQTYPWTYFKITGIDSNIRDGEDTYKITAVSSGAYVLNNLSLYGVQPNFSGKQDNISGDEYKGTPKNVMGKLIKWITQASCPSQSENGDLSSARIVFLGNGDGTIITGFDGKDFTKNYKYRLRDGSTLTGGDIETVENFFFDSTSNILTAKNFNLNTNSKTYSIKEVLDNLVDWLPDRIYYIAKIEDQIAAAYISYEDIYAWGNFFSSTPHKSEKMTYQIIEADACISNNDEDIKNAVNSKDGDKYFHKVYFIRMYYEGPGITNDNIDSRSYLRVYNYRSVQNQVIESIDISSGDNEIGNLISSVALLGVGTPVIFTYDKSTGIMNDTIISMMNTETASIENGGVKTETENGRRSRVSDVNSYESLFLGKSENDIKPFLALNNSKYVILQDFDKDETPTILSNKSEVASQFFTSQQNKQYTGEMTIMGDPFYYFDSVVEPGKYEIYLQMNRVKSRKDYSMGESKYTGIYFITGIKHSIDESGKYTTTLSIVKHIFGTSNENKNKEDDDKQ